MKLSDLEALVKAMRERADHHGHEDPNVEFYESNCPEFAAELGLKARDSYDTFISTCEKRIEESLRQLRGEAA